MKNTCNISESVENRQNLGISKESLDTEWRFFYNEFVSKILYNLPEMGDKEKEKLFCMEIVKRTSFVEIQFTNADAIVLKRTVRSKIPTWTFVEGLLSLCVGFSFLSLGEVSFWFVLLAMEMTENCGKLQMN